MYNSVQFPAETNNSGSKIPAMLIQVLLYESEMKSEKV